ncbi:REJ domain-containing protein, partial [Acinetobacter baumannii]
MDPDLPLTYQFSYYSRAGVKVVVRSSSLSAYGSAILPAGSTSTNYSVKVIADIFDNILANTTVLTEVTVTPNKKSANV